MNNPVSRLAPSPTGALHLGNARTFVINWAMARKRDWKLLLRIEDLDGPRVKPHAIEETLDILSWLGMDHDGEPIRQSTDLEPYRKAMEELTEKQLAYTCSLSRKEIKQASTAPHKGEHDLRYPSHLRPDHAEAFQFGAQDTNYRLIVSDEVVYIHDGFAMSREFHPFSEVGDFVIWTRRNLPAYQLAVVVDDARQGVTDVVRGDDLQPSAARQELLYQALGLSSPHWWHLPLVLGPDGRRLAKRHGDTRISSYRDQGVSVERIIGLLAFWSGIGEIHKEMSITDFLSTFSLSSLDPNPITFTEEDHAWLIGR